MAALQKTCCLHPSHGESLLEQADQLIEGVEPATSISRGNGRNNINTLFRYPAGLRKAIYTTNAIESLNSVIRKSIKKRKLLPSDDSAKKVV